MSRKKTQSSGFNEEQLEIRKRILGLAQNFGIAELKKGGSLARKLGVHNSVIKRLIDQESFPSMKTLATICQHAEISADYLLFGKEPVPTKVLRPLYILPGEKPEIPPGIRAEECYAVPLVSGRIAASHIGAIPGDLYDELVLVYKPQVGRLQHHNLRAVRLADDAVSMEPTIARGSIVVIDPKELKKPLSPKAIYAVRLEDTEGECVIKRVYDYPEDWVLISDNPLYEPIHVPKRHKPHLLIGRVIWCWTSWIK